MTKLFLNFLKKLLSFCSERIIYLEKAVSNLPEGSIIVTGKRECVYFYQHLDGRRNYLDRSNEGLKKALVQKEYYTRLLDELKRIEAVLLKAVNALEKLGKGPSAMEKMTPAKRALVSPFKMADGRDAKWSKTNSSYVDKSTHPYETAKGDWVRSKAEVIIADMLFVLGVPYIYECRVRINGKLYEPDFYILNCLTGQIIIWEHLGMMDDSAYIYRNAEKIMDYLSAGLIFGKNLIFSMESETCKLRTEVIRKMIDDYCLGYACL